MARKTFEKERVTVDLPKSIVDKIDAIVEEQERTRTAVVTDIFREYFKSKEQLNEAEKD